MFDRKRLILFALLLVALALPALASEQWLHVRVEDHRHGDETVHVNLPLSVVEAMLPAISLDELERGKISLDELELDGLEMQGVDLREMLLAFRDGPDTDLVTVREGDETLRVAKEGDYLIVRAEEAGFDDFETLNVRIPFPVLEALVGGDRDTLDLAAGLRALREYEGEEFVRIDSEDESVRIWIDSSQTGS
jgi:hypothetical protein